MGGTEQISSPLEPNFWRATTDNDRAGWRDALNPWRDAAEQRRITSVDVGRNSVLVKGTLPVGETKFTIEYTFLGNGTVKVDYELTPIGADLPPAIPKIGFQVQIPKTYTNVEWFGRGPEENYSDRNRGLNVGTYSKPLEEFWTNYPYPQENGNRTDVRWTAITNASGSGFIVAAEETMNISAWPFTVEDSDVADHMNLLPERDFYTLNIDLAQQGVGGSDTWSGIARAMPEYRLTTDKSYHFTFYLMPYNSANGDASKIGNVRF